MVLLRPDPNEKTYGNHLLGAFGTNHIAAILRNGKLGSK